MSRQVLLTAAVLILTLIGLDLDALRGDRRPRHDRVPIEPPLVSPSYGSSAR